MDYTLISYFLRLILACVLGGMIGLERDLHGRNAGIRTNMLVCVGAALFTIVSISVQGADPSRIAAQIVCGIGFLGAGAILKDGFNIRGLTTAAYMWFIAAVGISCGLGQWVLSSVGAIGVLGLTISVKCMERMLPRRLSMHIKMECASEEVFHTVQQYLKDVIKSFKLYSLDVKYNVATGNYTLAFWLDMDYKSSQVELCNQILSQMKGISPDLKNIQITCAR